MAKHSVQAADGSGLPTVYDPHEVEERWYNRWLEAGLFRAAGNPAMRPFTIVIPPPNVTGSLHMGHALDNLLQDILTRWKRMSGYDTLWLPGTDHAGIATQMVVEASLAKEGKSRHDLGRERFLQRVWEWKERYGRTIIKQLQHLGASCDWSRERFTMDDGCSRAVREAFVRLYEKGLIYRGDYIINWCPRCDTALSDLEVEHREVEGHLWHIRYPARETAGSRRDEASGGAAGEGQRGPAGDGVDAGDGVVIATTRPETMLGDTAVAVHPDDPRYRHLVGRKLRLPLMGRELPVVADEAIDPSFGTGALKVTPAHDPVDFEIGRRHGIPALKVIGTDGRMMPEAGAYSGLDRYECREMVAADLEREGLLIKVESHTHAVGHCQRCGTVIEPLLSRQWFVRMQPLADPAIKVVRDGRVRFIPDRFARIYLNWLENIRDWCISRQLWWGHRIPAWYCRNCGEIVVTRDDPDRCPSCSGSLEQDPDVLDTWFSSALWPFSTLGWPEQTPDLAHFFPTTVLVTGYDIIFFWVARMIFTSLEFTGEVPFHEVFIHGLVRDEKGRKMSKSKGIGLDPLEVIEEFGADTLRFSLVTGNTPGNDLRYYRAKVEGARNFANKIWNASRFVLMNLEEESPDREEVIAGLHGALELSDRWILSRYARVAAEVDGALAAYDLGGASRTLYDFIWSEFCDWYIELVKPRLYGENQVSKRSARAVLCFVLEGTLRLLHPFMPFLTEEIRQRLPRDGDYIVTAPWPAAEVAGMGLLDPEVETRMNILIESIRGIRNVRSEMHVPPGRKTPVIIRSLTAEAEDLLREGKIFIERLALAEPVQILPGLVDKPEGAATVIVPGAEVFVSLSGLIDLRLEMGRLEKELAEAREELQRARRKLVNPGFLEKAPEEVVQEERRKEITWGQKADSLQARIADLRG